MAKAMDSLVRRAPVGLAAPCPALMRAKMPMRSLDDFAVRKLEELDRASLRRTLAESFRGEGPWIEREGRRLLSFSCNDY